MTPCAINSHPPRIHIHSCPCTEAGCDAVPDPSCGDGNCDPAWPIGIVISICPMGGSYARTGAHAASKRKVENIFRTTNLIQTDLVNPLKSPERKKPEARS